MFTQITNWKEQEVKSFIQGVQLAKEKINNLRDIHGRNYINLVEYLDIPSTYRKLYWETDSTVSEMAEKEVESHIKKLQAKVEKKIGTIESINHIEADDYMFIGTQGSCRVEVIVAGGYNIQRKHTRWIIKK